MLGEIRLVEFRYEHGGHAVQHVQRSASIASRTAPASNPAEENTMVAPFVARRACQHHAEAVIHRHRDPHPVVQV